MVAGEGKPHWLVLLQLSTKSENQMPNTDYYKNFKTKRNLIKTYEIKQVAAETKQEQPLDVWPVGFKGGIAGEFPP